MKPWKCAHCGHDKVYYGRKKCVELVEFSAKDHLNIHRELGDEPVVEPEKDEPRFFCGNCHEDVTEDVTECRPLCGNDGTKWNRNSCEYGENGDCIHCGVGIPF